MVMSVPSHSACGKHGRTASGPTALDCDFMRRIAGSGGDGSSPQRQRPQGRSGTLAKAASGYRDGGISPRVGSGSEPKMMSGFGGKADMSRRPAPMTSAAFDP